MPYKISKNSYDIAKELNVTIKPSSNPKKKVDVYKDGKKVASIGATNYNDYNTYIKSKGLDYANKRKKLYRLRHKNDLNKPNGYYANKILWS